MAQPLPPRPFKFPDFYHFPPFFTLQSSPETRNKQLQLWSQYVVDYCRSHKISELQLATAAASPLFSNSTINRKLSSTDIIVVLDTVASNGYGKWLVSDKSSFAITEHTITELSSYIYKWADQYGAINTISTLEEIVSGVDSQGTQFHGLPYAVVYTALQHLEETGRCALFEGDDLPSLGVKFLKE